MFKWGPNFLNPTPTLLNEWYQISKPTNPIIRARCGRSLDQFYTKIITNKMDVKSSRVSPCPQSPLTTNVESFTISPKRSNILYFPFWQYSKYRMVILFSQIWILFKTLNITDHDIIYQNAWRKNIKNEIIHQYWWKSIVARLTEALV